MRVPRPLLVPLVGLLLAGVAQAQGVRTMRVQAKGPATPTPPSVSDDERLDAVDHAARLARIALTGDLGFAPLPPVTARSPRDEMLFEDRRPVAQHAFAGSVPPGELLLHVIPAGPDGTGSDKPEIVQYQLGSLYDEDGPAHPLLVAYHGFGASANSVAAQSTLDEVCNERGWVYLSVTGLDDQLFGSPICQQHVEAAITWMLANHHVDPERVCMVGFSMGAGVAANFSARHRDPEGVMIAALGMVAGVSDWTATHKTGTAATKAILEGAFNFGGPPSAQAFAYQRASGMHFVPGSYPPLPGDLDVALSMSTNLEHVPVFLTWDVLDTVPLSKAQNPARERLFAELCPDLVVQQKLGTTDPVTGAFATHSWAVLDEEALLDFFADKRAVRRPRSVHAQVDRDAAVSHFAVSLAQPDAFAWFDADLAADGSSLDVRAVRGADTIVLAAQGAAITHSPRLVGRSDDVAGFRLGAEGLLSTPSYAVAPNTGAHVPGIEPEPKLHGFTLPVPPHGRLSADLVADPTWRAVLDLSSEPVALGEPVELLLDAPSTSTSALLVLSLDEVLTSLPGGWLMGVSSAPPSIVLALLLDEDGDLVQPVTLAAEPGLAGTTLVLQAITLGASGHVDVLSNLRVVHVLP